MFHLHTCSLPFTSQAGLFSLFCPPLLLAPASPPLDAAAAVLPAAALLPPELAWGLAAGTFPLPLAVVLVTDDLVELAMLEGALLTGFLVEVVLVAEALVGGFLTAVEMVAPPESFGRLTAGCCAASSLFCSKLAC